MGDPTLQDISPTEKPSPASPRVKSIQSFKCPACGGEINIRAAGISLSAVCAHCGTVVDVSDEKLIILQRANEQIKQTFLEIGQRGHLAGVVWEVIGYALKSDKTGVYYWDEYLLFNPYQGFRFLVQMDGHWSFVKVIKKEFDKFGFNTTVWMGMTRFKPFLQDAPIVQYVKGEFYWRIKKGDRSRTEDYVAPPLMLSFEYGEGEITAALCDYTEPQEIAAAFSLTKPMPPKKGVAPNQPNPVKTGMLFMFTCIALAAAMVIHSTTAAVSPAKELITIAETHVPGDQVLSFTSPPIEIPKQTNIQVLSYAPVDNQWVELGLSLENEATGEAFNMRQPIEYYHGVDIDGNWSEGGRTQEDFFSGVPPGTYRLVYEVDSGAYAAGQAADIKITLRRGVTPWSNLILTMLFILIWPGIAWSRKGAFESKRWMNSDFAPE
ncbi:MAG: DUF4178 domain-containing protein [Alphaproteobacteria bacterium]|nr:MAG: DUF4178 domain-containing protein [Alphaproteobacteria bacterium]